MMATVGSIIGLVAVLVLAIAALQSRGLPFERKALYAVVWIVIFLVAAFVMGRLMG